MELTTAILSTALAVFNCFEGEFEIFFRVLQIISAFFLVKQSFFKKKPLFPP